MATITERTLMDGTTAYKIQVKVKNQITGQMVVKAVTWHPSAMKNDRANQLALNQFATKFEMEVRSRYQYSNVIDRDITLKEFSEKWLQFVRLNRSAGYANAIQHVVRDINEKLGNYKLVELTPRVIQNWIDELKGTKKGKVRMILTCDLKVMLQRMDMTQLKVCKLSGLSRTTLSKLIKKNEPVDYEIAKKISKALNKDDPLILFKPIEETQEYKSSTIARKYRTLRAILSHAVRHQYLERNYASADYIETVKEDSHERDFLDEKEIKVLLESLKTTDNPRARIALNILIFTGLRNGELCGLEWKDIDFEKHTLTVSRASKYEVGKGTVTGKTKTRNSMRTFTIPNILIDELLEYKKWWEVFVSVTEKYDGSDRLLLNLRGTPISPKETLRWLHKELERAGLRKVCIHSLRHSNITIQLAAGVPLKTVSVRAGHSTTKITADIYAHMIQSSDVQAACALEKILS